MSSNDKDQIVSKLTTLKIKKIESIWLWVGSHFVVSSATSSPQLATRAKLNEEQMNEGWENGRVRTNDNNNNEKTKDKKCDFFVWIKVHNGINLDPPLSAFS